MSRREPARDVRTERDLRLPPELAEGYQATFARLCRMFRARGVPPAEAPDLAQETITRTLLHLRRRRALGDVSVPVDAGAAIDPLLKRIATNLLIDRARAAAPQLLPIDGAEDVASATPDPSEEVARRQQRRQVHRAIDDLSARHRTAMLLSLEGLTPAEIAGHLGIRRNAADALLYRARRSLAKHLGAIAGLIRGLAVLVAVRVRAAGRRGAGALRFVEPVASAGGQAAFGIAAATLGAILAFTVPTAPSARAAAAASVDARPRATATIAGVARPSAAHAVVTPSPAGRAGTPDAGRHHVRVRPSASIDPQERDASTSIHLTDPSTGEQEGMGLDLDYQRDPEDRGLAGPILDEWTMTACETTKACDE